MHEELLRPQDVHDLLTKHFAPTNDSLRFMEAFCEQTQLNTETACHYHRRMMASQRTLMTAHGSDIWNEKVFCAFIYRGLLPAYKQMLLAQDTKAVFGDIAKALRVVDAQLQAQPRPQQQQQQQRHQQRAPPDPAQYCTFCERPGHPRQLCRNLKRVEEGLARNASNAPRPAGTAPAAAVPLASVGPAQAAVRAQQRPPGTAPQGQRPAQAQQQPHQQWSAAGQQCFECHNYGHTRTLQSAR